MLISGQALADFDQRYTVNLVNSLSGFKSANLIGTVNQQGQTNVAIFSSVFHVGANPPLMGMISRPDSVPRHTLENIRETGVYTINHVNKGIYAQAHLSSARSAVDESEFEFCDLTDTYLPDFAAPFVAESDIQIGLAVREIKPIELNGCHLIIGEVMSINLEASLISDDGYIDIERAGSVAVSGLDNYHVGQRLARLPYAKRQKTVA